MSFLNKIKSILGEPCWGIGFMSPIIFDSPNTMAAKIKWIKGVPSDRWYADPFIVDYDKEKIILLAEEYMYNTQIGTIAELTINRKTNRIVKIKDILKLSTHLSFPLLFEDGANLYLCPENYQSGGWSVYKYDKNKHIIGPPVLLIDQPLVDVSCVKIDKKYFVFGTKYSDDFSNAARQLYIYSADNFMGPYEQHQVIEFDNADARGAGAIISHGGKMIIPTQNCNGSYGKEVIFSQLSFENNRFSVAEKFRISPKTFSRYCDGRHTYNQRGEIAVVDGVGRRYGRIISFLSSIYRTIIYH